MARKGIELAKQYQPDFIIMDLDMPEMNGFEALTRIKKLKSKITPYYCEHCQFDYQLRRGIYPTWI